METSIIVLLLLSIIGLAVFVYLEMNGKLKKFSPEVEEKVNQLEKEGIIPL